MGKVIAICNQKGGTSKTTTTINLGIGLAKKGQKVCVIDADAQGDLTSALGWRNPDDIDNTLGTLINSAISDEPINIECALLHHEEGIDVIPANIDLSSAEMRLVSAMSREYALKEVISKIQNKYSYVLIDCMPSLGMITINALTAADSVIIPVQTQYLPAKGMTQLIKTINKVRHQLNPNIKIDGVLLTLSDSRTNLAKETIALIRENYGHVMKVYDSVIPLNAKAAETSAIGKSIFSHDENGKAAAAYERFIKEILDDDKEKNKSRPTLCR
jgi:chromosome partitioning protein